MLHKKRTPTPPVEPKDLPAPALLEVLLGVHNAQNEGWLADAAATAAERGLGALYGLLYLTDSSGQLQATRAASSARLGALGRLNQLLATNVSSLRIDPKTLPAVASALVDGGVRVLSQLSEAFPLDAAKLGSAQRKLGVKEVWLVPLAWGGEISGLLVLLMPDGTSAALPVAELLGRHVAVALSNLRKGEAGRRRGQLDPVRWIYDEHRFQDQLALEIQRAQRHQRPLSILFLQVGSYYDLRARYGRFLAERLLRQIASRVEETLRTTDFLAAFNENGVAGILVEADRSAAERTRERVLEALADVSLPEADLPDLDLQLACATATLPEDGTTERELAAVAEARLGGERKEDAA